VNLDKFATPTYLFTKFAVQASQGDAGGTNRQSVGLYGHNFH